MYEVAQLVVPAGLRARVAARAVDAFGDDAARRLRDDPWRLLELPDVRVVEADRVAVSALPGVRRDDPRRGRALVAHALNRAARDGHTVQPVELVLAALGAEGVADPPGAVAAAIEAGTVHDADGTLSLQRLAMAESAVAEAIARLTATAEPIEPEDARRRARRPGRHPARRGRHGAPARGQRAHRRPRHRQEPHRRRARPAGREAGPRGRAGRADRPGGQAAGGARRSAPAATLHRLLGAQGRTGGFARGEEWPLDAELVVVDETSMLDVELAAALLEACADGTHLLLVGDPAQLPSIGPGRVLADLVESGTVPVIELTTLYRQADGGAIARLATAVRAGELPPVDAPDREVVLVRAAGSAEAAHRVVQLVTDSIPGRLGIPADDVQVVTPVHKGPAGTVELNRVLKATLNPGRGTVSGFDPGDRVVATANHLEAEPVGFANGEVGVVTEAKDGAVTVEFASGPAAVTGRALADLRHGWAVTVHRAQGSEWPAVVAVLPPEAGGMLSRPLVYTALTRAQRHLSVVPAVGPALARAVRDVGARPRRTRLRELLSDELQESGG